ncbi:MAG TPA: hypothetical protein ACN46K_01805 [Prochlorococcus sp.]
MDRQLGADTIGKILSGRQFLMAVSEHPASFEQLFSKRLHGFSELSESLILRLIQLEERVAKLESSQALKEECHHDATQELLAESEERVRHLEGLLNSDPIKCSSLHAISDVSAEEQIDQVVKFKNRKTPQDLDVVREVTERSEIINQDIDNQAKVGDEGIVETEYVDEPQTDLL